MTPTSRFSDALTRLDADIEAAERHLAELRLKRKGAEAFLAYMEPDAIPAPRSGVAQVEPDLFHDVVASFGHDTFTVDVILRAVSERGTEMTREQVRNRIHYMVRKGVIASVRRGAWRFKDSETPVTAGVSVGNTPSIQEGGDSHETRQTAQAESNYHPQLGASIGMEVAS